MPVVNTLFGNIWADNVKCSPQGSTYNKLSSPWRGKFPLLNVVIWRIQETTEKISQLNPLQCALRAEVEVKGLEGNCLFLSFIYWSNGSSRIVRSFPYLERVKNKTAIAYIIIYPQCWEQLNVSQWCCLFRNSCLRKFLQQTHLDSG